MDYSLLGSSVCRIFEDRMLEWVAISISIRSSQPRDRTQVSCIVGRRFTIWATREATFFRGGGTKRSFVLHPLPQPHSACCSSPCLLPEGVSLGSFFKFFFWAPCDVCGEESVTRWAFPWCFWISGILHSYASWHSAFSNLEILAGFFPVCIPTGLCLRLSDVHIMFLLRGICLYLGELSDGFKEIDSFIG